MATRMNEITHEQAANLRALAKGCPFCGYTPIVTTYGVVACDNDQCRSAVSVTRDTSAEAVASWNKRV